MLWLKLVYMQLVHMVIMSANLNLNLSSSAIKWESGLIKIGSGRNCIEGIVSRYLFSSADESLSDAICMCQKKHTITTFGLLILFTNNDRYI